MKRTYGLIGFRHSGGLDFDNYDYIKSILSEYRGSMERLISGGGRGIEQLAERWASETKTPFERVKPRVNMISEHVEEPVRAIDAAFTIRNMEIIHVSDALIVFWNGKEAMALTAMACANKFNKPVLVYPLAI